jgi:hypothetical protein
MKSVPLSRPNYSFESFRTVREKQLTALFLIGSIALLENSFFHYLPALRAGFREVLFGIVSGLGIVAITILIRYWRKEDWFRIKNELRRSFDFKKDTLQRGVLTRIIFIVSGEELLLRGLIFAPLLFSASAWVAFPVTFFVEILLSLPFNRKDFPRTVLRNIVLGVLFFSTGSLFGCIIGRLFEEIAFRDETSRTERIL